MNSLLDHADWMDFLPGLDCAVTTSSLAFDASLEEVYGTWTAGCPVVAFSPDQVKGGPEALKLLQEERITVME